MPKERDKFVKSQALGNDYIIIEPSILSFPLTSETVRAICDRHHGIGSDGILALTPSEVGAFGVRIYNPDGSEAEKRGNGLRIFAKFLYDHGLTNATSFTVETLGGIVTCAVSAPAGSVNQIQVDMGRASFRARDIPVAGADRDVVGESLRAAGREFQITSVNIGNPHCVVFTEQLKTTDLDELGSLIECHPLFPRRTNVQFAQVISRGSVRILIWERGAGHTLASGSSACAVAAACVRHGFTDPTIEVEMEGGPLVVKVSDDFQLRLTGPASEVCAGSFSADFVATLKTLKK
jgi:diaminopimelate epimerase